MAPILPGVAVAAGAAAAIWLINAYAPVGRAIKNIVMLVVFIAAVLWLANHFGVIGIAHVLSPGS